MVHNHHPFIRPGPRIIVGLAILTALVFISQYIAAPSDEPGTPDRTPRSSQALLSFVDSFPEMRDREARGRPGMAHGDAGIAEFDWPGTRSMFVFGDSYSASEGTPPDFEKDGVDDGIHDEFMKKHSDFKWTDYLYVSYHDLHALHYWNFANAGAVIDESIVKSGRDDFGSFVTQLDLFKEFFTPMPGPRSVNWQSEDSLFVILLGMNDVGKIDRSGYAQVNVTDICDRLIQSMLRGCRRLHYYGARNLLILNLPPMELAPKYTLPNGVGHNIERLVANATASFNSFLGPAVDAFRQEHEGNVMFFDLYDFTTLAREYPELFGFTELHRYQFHIKESHKNLGKAGFFFNDHHGHPTWSFAHQLARTVNGFLMRHSRSLRSANLTEVGIRY